MAYISEVQKQENPGLKTVIGLDKPDNRVIGGMKGSKICFEIEIRKDIGGNAYMAANVFGKL